MKHWFHSIGARIFAGFGMFIAALAVFFFLTARTTQQQSDLLEQSARLDQAKTEVAKLQQRVEAMRAYALLAARLPEPSHLHIDAHRSLDELQSGFEDKLLILRDAAPEQSPVHERLFRHHLASDALLDALQGLVPPGTRKAELELDFDRLWKVDELLDNPFEPGADLASRLDSLEQDLGLLEQHFTEAAGVTNQICSLSIKLI